MAAVHPKDTWREIWSRRLFGSREFKGRRFFVVIHLEAPNPEVPIVPEIGLTTSSGEFRAVRSRGTRGANSSHLGVSLIVVSRDGDQPLPIHKRRKLLCE
jgi:hypothetical protein